MKNFARDALSIGAAAALLAGCVLREPQNDAPPSGLPQSRTAATDAEGGGSWMAPTAGNSDLLYIPNTSYVSVFRYRQRDLVGTLQGFNNIVAACSDSSANVYFVDKATENIYEFAHGGTIAINTFEDSPYEPVGCSVNPLTGDLAVANSQTNPYGNGNIAIFPRGTGKPKIYTRPLRYYTGCAYDDQGDLLTTNGADINQGDSGFAWFAAGARRLIRIKL